ncbi:MAG: hypothetical protein HY393_03465 [Candidatus Diapherotrites archaeon]|nr:hypothetical protein [Candidatus Diapherotrites archaeon]
MPRPRVRQIPLSRLRELKEASHALRVAGIQSPQARRKMIQEAAEKGNIQDATRRGESMYDAKQIIRKAQKTSLAPPTTQRLSMQELMLRSLRRTLESAKPDKKGTVEKALESLIASGLYSHLNADVLERLIVDYQRANPAFFEYPPKHP